MASILLVGGCRGGDRIAFKGEPPPEVINAAPPHEPGDDFVDPVEYRVCPFRRKGDHRFTFYIAVPMSWGEPDTWSEALTVRVNTIAEKEINHAKAQQRSVFGFEHKWDL